MLHLSKLYSYYFTNLFRKNWIKITIFFLLVSLGTWFLTSFGALKVTDQLIESAAQEKNISFLSYKGWNKLFLNDGEIGKKEKEVLLKERKEAWEELIEARKNNDEVKIEEAKQRVKIAELVGWGSKLLFSPPTFHEEVNDFFLGIESKSKGLDFWKLINNLGWWTLATGFTFTWLTLSLIDFLFNQPKKNGEEALVLTFTPGVQRSDLLISKILVFLTYFSLFSLVAFVLPAFFYYLWIGSLVSFSSFLILFAYILLVAPLLIFGLLLLPYILLSSWSSVLGSIVPWILYIAPLIWSPVKNFSGQTIFYQIENFFFNPLVFVPLALTVGIICLTIYYWKFNTEDLKG